MKRNDIVAMLREMKPIRACNDGPTALFVSGKGNAGRMMITGDMHNVTVMVGNGIFRRRYQISRSELQLERNK
nr:hypothetical protein [Maliibacterium massiliense]